MNYNQDTTGHNNGRVASTIDHVVGETVDYRYDVWNRLITESATKGESYYLQLHRFQWAVLERRKR